MVTKGQYWAIKHSLTAAQKALINFYEMQWMIKHTVPTVEEVVEYLRKDRPNIRQISVNYYLTQPQVIKALEQRGIPFRQHTREELTDQQIAAAVTVMNFADTRSIDHKLDSIGVLPATYYAWLNDPTFKAMIDSLSEQNLVNIKPTAITEFTKLINKGDWQAIRYYLDVTGAVTANKDNMPKSEVLLRMLVEIIQKHVKDSDTIIAIAQDMQMAMANRTLELATNTQPSIEGYSVPASEELDYDSPEVLEAQHKLGY